MTPFGRVMAGAGLLAATLAGGCEMPVLPASIGAELEVVQEILADDDLSPQEQRDALAALGLSPVEINGLMEAERLGNQFGGTLATARDKVIADQIDTMTPDEMQVYGDAAGATLSDAQAAALMRLFTGESLSSQDDVSMWLDDPANELPAGVTEATVRTVFVDTDPDDLIDQL